MPSLKDAFTVEIQAEMRPGIIELRWGLPDPALIPVEAIGAAAQAALKVSGAAALGRGVSEGSLSLRDALAERISRTEDRTLDLDEIMITAGNSAAISQILQLVVRSGDVVLVEDPSYSLAIGMARDLGVDLVGVPVDEHGMQVERLPEIVAAVRRSGRVPRLIYTIPTFHNPTGVCLAAERRRLLLELAVEAQLLVLEDDAYRDLSYEGEAPASLWSLARSVDGASECVVRLGSFSKTIAPGLRCGWLTSTRELTQRFAQSGPFAGGSASQFTASLIVEMLRSGVYDEHTARLRGSYGERCRTLVRALRSVLPDGCSATSPTGGFFATVSLPDGLEATQVLSVAEAKGVSFAGGPGYSVSGLWGGMRLCFSMYDPASLSEACARLGRTIAEAIEVVAR